MPKGLSPKLLGALAMRSVEVAAAVQGLTGKQRHKAARKDLARKLDKLIVFPPTPLGVLAELLDGPILALCGGLIQDAFDRRKAKRAAEKRADK